MSRAAARGLTLTGRGLVRAAVRGVALRGAQTGRAAARGVKITGTVSRPKAAVRGVRLIGDVGRARAAIRGLTLTGGGQFTANAGGGRTVEPFSTVTLDGAGSTGATSWSWSQVSGPAVVLVGAGPVVSFVAPATEAGVDVVIRLTVSDGVSTATDDATVSVYPHLFWRRQGTSWVPQRMFDGIPARLITRWGTIGTGDAAQTGRQQLTAIGADRGMVELSWARLQPTGPGTAFDATESATIVQRITNMKAAGLSVTIGPGLHFEPAWVFTAGGDAVLWRNVDGVKIKGDGGNYVFSQQMRAWHRDYLQRVAAMLGGLSGVSGWRVTGGRPELMYPQSLDDGSAGSDWWCYDTAATTGVGLAEGMTPMPFPAVIPSTLNRPEAERRANAEWYVDGLRRYADWHMDVVDGLGFTGVFHIPAPGVGIRPSEFRSDIVGTSTYALPRSSRLAQGVAWYRIFAALTLTTARPATRVMPWCTDIAKYGQANGVPQPGDLTVPLAETDTTVNSWASPRLLARIAAARAMPVGGENPGRTYVTPAGNTSTLYTDDYDSPTGMVLRVAEIVRNQVYPFAEFGWARATEIIARPSLLAAYQQIIAAAAND